MTIKVSIPAKELSLSPEQVMKAYADHCCRKNGWAIGSGAWKVLADYESLSPAGIADCAKIAFHDCIVEVQDA